MYGCSVHTTHIYTRITGRMYTGACIPAFTHSHTTVWYGMVEFNVPLDTVQVISETGALSSDVHLSFSNG